MDKISYWDERALAYANLNWVKDAHSINLVIEVGKFAKTDVVLDIGTGLGAVAMAVSPLVDKIIGIDHCRKMLAQAEKADNVFYVEWDVRMPLFAPNTFDKVTIRQMLHHIPKDTIQATVGLCEEVLRSGGGLIIAEGVCPSTEIEKEYAHIFELKDKRNVLTKRVIVELMMNVGFQQIKTTMFALNNFSVRNWLSNNALSPEMQEELFNLHINASPQFKSAFNMQITDRDCLIDIQNVLVVGIKS